MLLYQIRDIDCSSTGSIPAGPRPWILSLKKQLSKKDKRRVAANKMKKKYQTTTKKSVRMGLFQCHLPVVSAKEIESVRDRYEV